MLRRRPGCGRAAEELREDNARGTWGLTRERSPDRRRYVVEDDASTDDFADRVYYDNLPSTSPGDHVADTSNRSAADHVERHGYDTRGTSASLLGSPVPDVVGEAPAADTTDPSR